MTVINVNSFCVRSVVGSVELHDCFVSHLQPQPHGDTFHSDVTVTVYVTRGHSHVVNCLRVQQSVLLVDACLMCATATARPLNGPQIPCTFSDRMQKQGDWCHHSVDCVCFPISVL